MIIHRTVGEGERERERKREREREFGTAINHKKERIWLQRDSE